MGKRTTFLVAIALTLMGLSAVLNTSMTNAPILPAMAQPINTPAAPIQVQSPISKLPISAVATKPLSQVQVGELVVDQQIRDTVHLQPLSEYTRAMHRAGVRFTGSNIAGPASPPAPQSPAATCMTMLGNPQMDILKTGETTGTIDSWVILFHKVYYDDDPGYYNSPFYSLVMVDESFGADPTISSTLDYDAFGQVFLSPSNLMTVTINYSRLYTNTNASDTAAYWLWTVDSQGYLDQPIVGYNIGESPSGWSNRQTVITDSAVLAALSGKTLALIFDLATDRQVPGEVIWLDDAQVTMCYASGASKVYLPLVTKQPVQTGPVCTPVEPDNRDNRGYTMVGATCYGSFSPSDDKDYYTLNLNGVANVRLQLANLPAGSNYDALIYEYPYTGQPPACYIGTPGSQNKFVDCPPLDLGKTYFAFVNAGGAPSSPKTYEMSVLNPAGACWTTLISTDLEGSFPIPWQVSDNNGSNYGEYYWAKRGCKPYAGSYSGWAVGGGSNGTALSCGANYPNYANSWLVYGPFSLVSATTADLKFKLWLNSELNYDGLCWMASINGTNFSGTCTTGNTSGWVDRTLDLTNVYSLGNLLGQPNVWIALIFTSDNSITLAEGAFVDNIVLRKCTCATCPAVSQAAPDLNSGRVVDIPATMTLNK